MGNLNLRELGVEPQLEDRISKLPDFFQRHFRAVRQQWATNEEMGVDVMICEDAYKVALKYHTPKEIDDVYNRLHNFPGVELSNRHSGQTLQAVRDFSIEYLEDLKKK